MKLTKQYKHFKHLTHLPQLDLLTELDTMMDTGVIHWPDLNQLCLNTTTEYPDSPYYGVGSLDLDYDAAYEEIDENGHERKIVPKRSVMLSERDFTELATPFKNTLFEEFYQILTDNYLVGRVRIMKMRPNHSMSWHYDYNTRLHYPLKTQIGCFMLIEDEVLHLEQNNWYYTDTKKYHTAFNGSREDRLHIVACLLED
jgi:hypothetical protein